ncbi:MAG: general secretion pathway protein GspK [Pseudomonadales bacterium]|nr:general secretion pathway protein GspK [Pseudomonadales bacterium]
MNASAQRGFILVATIWLTALMLGFAAWFSFYANNQLEKALLSKERAEGQLDLEATEATLFYLIATNAIRRRGLEVNGVEGRSELIRTDGVLYQGIGSTKYALQGYEGLVGLNTKNHFHLDLLLSDYESDSLRKRSLLAALSDYIDKDNVARMSGQESGAYRVAGLTPPANEYLVTPMEIEKVYGWSEWLGEHPEFDVEKWLSSNWRTRVNLNSAPTDLLVRILPVKDADALSLNDRRSVKPFQGMSDVNQTLNLRAALDEDFYTFLPSEKVKLLIYSGKACRPVLIAVQFSPLSISSPWKVDYRYHRECTFSDREVARLSPKQYFGRQLSSAEG